MLYALPNQNSNENKANEKNGSLKSCNVNSSQSLSMEIDDQNVAWDIEV